MSLGGRPSQRKKLSLEQERAMLAELRETGRSVSPGEYQRIMCARLGVAHFDQVEAASRDAERAVLQAGEWPPFRHYQQTDSHEHKVALMAGVLRCLAGHRCRHAPYGDRPLFVFLAARVIACERCLPRFRGTLAAQDARAQAGRDRLCDLCLREADHFRPTATHFGPHVVFGDSCDECFARTGGLTKASA